MALTVFYDDLCPLCRTEMLDFHQRFPERLQLMPISSHESTLTQQHQIGLQDALDSIHVLDEMGRWHTGIDGMRLIYERCDRCKTAQFLNLPIIKPLSYRVYPIFAKYRYHLPVWLLGRDAIKNAEPTCHNGYCQLPSEHKAAIIQSKSKESDHEAS